jgi:uncharacterized RDD family membrane protein YckC
MCDERKYAGFLDRLFADVCDCVIAGLVISVPYFVVDRWLLGVKTFRSAGVVFVIWYLWNLTYLVGMHGQSWGRKIAGIKVINNKGGLIGFWRALGRNLFELSISLPFLYLGSLWVIWDRRKQAWHDKVFRTYVVQGIYRSRMKRIASAVMIAIGVSLFALDLLVIYVTGDSSNIGGVVGLLMMIAGLTGLWRSRPVAQERHPNSA